jgi:hypothetical protein
MTEHTNTIILLIKLFLNVRGMCFPSQQHTGVLTNVVPILLLLLLLGFSRSYPSAKRSSYAVYYKQLIPIVGLHWSILMANKYYREYYRDL